MLARGALHQPALVHRPSFGLLAPRTPEAVRPAELHQYARHAASVAQRRSNSARSRGKSSTGPHAISWGHRSQVSSQLR